MYENRVTAFVGHFGSGKTEVAVNYALNLRDKKEKVSIIDFDIINPFFRTADVSDVLEEKGIEVLKPTYANSNVDVPALTGEINKFFEDESIWGVIDVGGDDLGAKAVGAYVDGFRSSNTKLLFVVNTNRPLTSTVEGIIQYFNEIWESCGIKPHGIVNNTNLMEYTTEETVIEGLEICQEAARQLGVGVEFSCVMEDVELKEFKNEYLKLRKNLKKPWE